MFHRTRVIGVGYGVGTTEQGSSPLTELYCMLLRKLNYVILRMALISLVEYLRETIFRPIIIVMIIYPSMILCRNIKRIS